MPKLSVIGDKEREPIIFGKPNISEAEIQAVTKVLKSGWIGSGPVVRRFEEAFSEYIGGYAVAVSSGTMALNLALRVSNAGDKKEVITTPLTFSATVNAIIRAGAKPVFVDVDNYGNLDADKIDSAWTKHTQAILPVHYTGGACDMGKIMAFAKGKDLKVIEDTAHGFGGEYVGRMAGGKPALPRKLGTMGDYGCFSFHAVKNITCGEGGMVVTKRGDMAERMRILANQGQNNDAYKRFRNAMNPYEIIHDGYKGNMSDINASIGLVQLQRWPELQAKRAVIFQMYENEFGLKQQGHSQHLYTIEVENRDQLRNQLYEMGIYTGIHYDPLHLEPAYKNLGYKAGDFPNAEKIGRRTLSLPIHAGMSEKDAERVIKAIKTYQEVS